MVSGLTPDSYDPVLDSLDAVTVTADRGVTVSRTDTVSVRNSLSLAQTLQQGSSFHVINVANAVAH